jgi:hypothetical protein
MCLIFSLQGATSCCHKSFTREWQRGAPTIFEHNEKLHLHWLLGRRSTLSIESKLLQYKAVLKPIWTYGIQLWETDSNSNIEILQRFQSKTLRSILNAPWYINNHRIQEDLKMNTVLSEIKKWNTKYFRKLEKHTKALAVNLLDNSETTNRLISYIVLTLPDRPE